MADSPKQTPPRARPEGLSKLVPSRHRADTDDREPDTRHRFRNALPGTHHSAQTRDKQHRSTKKAAKDTVQSALELRPPINFDHLLRRDKRTPAPSRRGSSNNIHGDNALTESQQQSRILQKRVGINDVKRSKEDNEKREQELRKALQRVEEQGMQGTRELDNTYYLLLEKAGILRDIVGSMQKLAKDSRSLREDFRKQSRAIQSENEKVIDDFADFTQQEDTIKGLLARLESYRKRTAALNDRLETAKTRVEASEKRFLDAQAQRKKRWDTTWAIMLIIVVAVLGILIAKQYPPKSKAWRNADHAANDLVSPILARLKPKPSEDPYLHSLFDGIS